MRSLILLPIALVAVVSTAGCGHKKRLMCERPVTDLPTPPGGVLWFGEMHGTEQSPRFVGDVACTVARYDRVQLGLEIWQSEQLRINSYLMNGDRVALLEGAFWKQHDGRSSNAMVALLDRVRDLRGRGAKMEVVAYDIVDETDRDAAMARTVLAARDDGATFIGLSGNIHSRKTQWNELTPLVAHLVEKKLKVSTYDVSSSGGTYWACMATPDHDPVCGEHPSSDDGGKARPGTIGPAKDPSHDGVYFVGPTKPSTPARPTKT